MKANRILFFLLLSFLVHTDQIELENKTDHQVAAAIYSVDTKKSVIIRQSPPSILAPQASILLDRSPFSFGKDRELIFSDIPETLTETLDKNSFERLNKQNIGFLKGKKFYITYQNGKYFAYSSLYTPIQKLTELTNDQIQKILATYGAQSKERLQVASIRQTNQLGDIEKQFITKRKIEIKKNLENLLKEEVAENKIPIIGICLSGGGFRAMLGSIGFLRGLEEEKILDVISYVSVLSGSSWAVIPWMMTGQAVKDMSLRLQQASLGNFYSINSQDFFNIELALLTKWYYRQPLTIVDLWGALVANSVLTSIAKPQLIGFSNPSSKIEQAQLPLPLATMVTNSLAFASKEYAWFEVSPFEFGSAEFPVFLPTWAAGRYFKNGVSIDYSPELTAAFIMGICGSAFAVGVGDILDRLPISIDKLGLLIGPLLNIFEQQYEFIRRSRLIPGGYIRNPLYKVVGAPNSHLHYLEMVDAGYAFNLPFPPLLRPERIVDIIIAFDLGGDIIGVPALISAAQYAHKHGLKFPIIDYKQAEKKHFSIFGDPDNKNELVVVYIPRIANKTLTYPYNEFDPEKAAAALGFASTFNFKYTKENASLLEGYAHDTVRFHKAEILELIKRRVRVK